jgi:hypothetical protein
VGSLPTMLAEDRERARLFGRAGGGRLGITVRVYRRSRPASAGRTGRRSTRIYELYGWPRSFR